MKKQILANEDSQITYQQPLAANVQDAGLENYLNTGLVLISKKLCR